MRVDLRGRQIADADDHLEQADQPVWASSSLIGPATTWGHDVVGDAGVRPRIGRCPGQGGAH